MVLRAASVSRSILEALPIRSELGVVHSAYAHTVNITWGDSFWVSLHPEGEPRHPFAMTVRGSWCRGGAASFLGIDTGEQACVSKSWIRMGQVARAGRSTGGRVLSDESRSAGAGRISISLAVAEIWDGRLERLTTLGVGCWQEAADLLALLVARIAGDARLESPFLAGVLGWGDGPDVADTATSDLDRHLRFRVRAVLSDLDGVLLAGQSALLAATVKRAIGLGTGLTPSGDDFLAGLLAASWLWPHPGDAHGNSSQTGEGRSALGELVTAVLNDAALSTTMPSYFMLRAAARGEFCEPLIGLLAALARGDAGEAGRQLDEVLGLGHTSGQDLIAGMLFWFGALRGRERRYEASVC